MASDGATVAQAAGSAVARVIAAQEIEYLRRSYARATDRIGENTEEAIADGRIVYHRIFTPDVSLRVSGAQISGDPAIGPDAWVDVVAGALAEFSVTQHLIGTQLVDIEHFETNASGEIVSGSATMTSYLQAWHARPDNNVWLFLGTYHDKVRFAPDVGWQIYDSVLERVSGEERPMGEQ